MRKPLCLVIAPFGTQQDGSGAVIDFDLTYRSLIMPAIEMLGLAALRMDELALDADEGPGRGPPAINLGQASIARVVAADAAVFDITTGSPSVHYHLGIRHAMRPHGTLVVAARGVRVPWDLSTIRVLFYELNAAGRPENAEQFHQALAEYFKRAWASKTVDSPVYSTLPRLQIAGLDELAAMVQSDDAERDAEIRRRIASAKRLGADELHELEEELGDISRIAPEVALALFDAYRACAAWQSMIELAEKMPEAVASTARVQEQLALALNRAGQSARAERILEGLLLRNGPSSETFGLLGRIHKDRWQAAARGGNEIEAEDHLDRAIECYLKGFETDWRDPYPGVNAVTLMSLRRAPDPRLEEVLPVVLYAAKRKLVEATTDYWAASTLLELQVVAGRQKGAQALLPRVRSLARDPWQSATTASNLRLLAEARSMRGDATEWIYALVGALEQT